MTLQSTLTRHGPAGLCRRALYKVTIRLFQTLAVITVSLIVMGCANARSQGEGGSFPAVVYKNSIDDVFKASLEACRDYFHRIDKVDYSNYTIFINNNNFWAGDTDVNIKLVESKDGVLVSVESHGAGLNQPLWNRSKNDLSGFYNALAIRIDEPRTQSPKSNEERLKELKKLNDEGVISDEEYQAKRNHIINSL